MLSMQACTDSVAKHFKLTGFTMGTTYHVTVVEPKHKHTDQQQLQSYIDQGLMLVNQQMSTYIEDSEISRLNKWPVNQALPVSPALFDVLTMSLELSWLTNGAFDITIGPLVNLWGFGSKSENVVSKMGKGSIPSDQEIARLLAKTGFEFLQFDLSDSSVVKQRPLALDLSGIAKGYGADVIGKILVAAGYEDFMVEVGGEIYTRGNSPRGSAWRIAIEQPDGGFGQVAQAVSIANKGMATSGDYRNYFEQDGRRYSHTIDPKTGKPITHTLASVTVIADSTAYADGLATAINVLGPEKGLKLANQQDLAVFLLLKTADGFEAQHSAAFQPYLE